MRKTLDARMEIRLTRRMKGRIEKAAKRYRTTPSKLLRAVFYQWDEKDRQKRR